MSLMIPGGPGFTYCQDNISGSNPVAAPGTTFTVSGSNVDGNPHRVMVLTRDCHYLVVGFGNASAVSTEDNSMLIDVLGDPAGGTAYASINIDNLLYNSSLGFGNAIGYLSMYHLPIFIKSGTSLAVRGRKNGSTTTTAMRCYMAVYGEPMNPDRWWYGSGVEPLGITEASSKGTNIAAGSTGANGAWYSIGTSTRRYGALQFHASGGTNALSTATYQFQIGIGSQQLPGTPTFSYGSTATELAWSQGTGVGPLLCNISSGSAFQVRGSCSISGSLMSVAIYGVY